MMSKPHIAPFRMVIVAALVLASGWFYLSSNSMCSDCIVPNRGVGDLNLKDSYPVMLRKWGQPDVIVPKNAIETQMGRFWAHYTMKGISVEFGGAAGKNYVQSIHLLAAGSFTPTRSIEPNHFEKFTGKLDEIIGIGSTKVEVDQHIGGIFIVVDDDNPESDIYNCKRAVLDFEYDGNIVKQISVNINRSDGCYGKL